MVDRAPGEEAPAPRPLRLTAGGADDFAQALRQALRYVHQRSSTEPIRFPSTEGAFPDSYFVPPPPVVLDANRLRDDILYACRNDQRTTLVTAANTGLLRLFCAQHVIDEVVEHSADWTDGSGVSRTDFLRRWMLEYLPVIRVISSDDVSDSLLDPDETARVGWLARVDPDDVPSVRLALVLGAFYLSNDSRALRAVYGLDADLSEHAEWVEMLKAGGDAGELGRIFHVAIAMLGLLGSGVVAGAKRIATALGPWGLLLILGLAAALLVKRTSDDTKQRLKSAATSVGTALLLMSAAYGKVLSRFERAAPTVPGWDALATTNDPDAVLTRACLYTLARSLMSVRSAEELAQQLPSLGVAQGEAKVRSALRAHGCFFEVWRGRWQVGEVAQLLAADLDRISEITA